MYGGVIVIILERAQTRTRKAAAATATKYLSIVIVINKNGDCFRACPRSKVSIVGNWSPKSLMPITDISNGPKQSFYSRSTSGGCSEITGTCTCILVVQSPPSGTTGCKRSSCSSTYPDKNKYILYCTCIGHQFSVLNVWYWYSLSTVQFLVRVPDTENSVSAMGRASADEAELRAAKKTKTKVVQCCASITHLAGF